MINEQENKDKNIKDYENENPFDIEDDKTWGDMINEQENNEKNINQIDHEDKEFNLDN